MKILVISEMSVPHTSGGGETRYALLTRELVAMGHDVTWLSMRQRSAPDEELLDGVRHRHVGPRIRHPPLRPLLAKLWFMACVVGHLLRHRYDVVDCQTYAPLPAAWLGGRLARVPVLAAIHDTSSPSPGRDQWLSAWDGALAGLVERRLYRLPYDHVITGSEAVRVDLCGRYGLPEARVTMSPNGIDVAAIEAVAAHPDKADLIFVGRLIPHKHPEVFLQAAAWLSERWRAQGRSPPRLKVIGGGPLAESLAAEAAQLGLSAQIVAWGELPRHEDVVAHIKSSRLLVLPSTREGFGLVLVEAMAAGVPVLAANVPAVADTLGPTLADALFEPGEVQALGRAMAAVLEDAALHARRVQTGAQRVRSAFAVRPFAERVLAVYERLRAEADGKGRR